MNPMAWDAPWLVIAAALFVIVMFRANGTYWLGRLMITGAEHTRLRRLVDSPGYARAAGLIDRWGAPIVALSFLTIGVQTLVNLAAGAARMKLVHYLPAVTIGCVIWACVYATVGVISWSALTVLWQRSPALAIALGVLATIGLVWFVARHLSGRRTPADPADA